MPGGSQALKSHIKRQIQLSLIVYKSSAGSGKTSTLVKEYLKLTLKNPEIFRKVLAITFTNKAANEMKTRVIETLQILAAGRGLDKGAYSKLPEELGMSVDALQKQARRLLSLITHRYEEFSISTIDAFVNRIVRTFAIDVKLPQNFEVVIDADDIIPDIISDLFDKIGKEPALTDIMLHFVLSAIDDERSYDPAPKLYEFIQQQLKEDSFSYVKELAGMEMRDFLGIIKKIQSRQYAIASSIRETAAEAIELARQSGLESVDFYYGTKGIHAYFLKCTLLVKDEHLIANSYVVTTINQDKWAAPKASDDAKQRIEGIQSQLSQLFLQIQKLIPHHFLFKLVYSKIYAVALAKEIGSLFDAYTERTQKVHISEFNKRISSQIADQSVPFIYERLGSKYNYFLIDEFQDTSLLQWNNLLPLIEESLSFDHLNMLVGDAKQAIYRFRNGEVDLFTQLPKLLDHDGSALSQSREQLLIQHYTEVPLVENWRSKSVIIEFNNTFFGFLHQAHQCLEDIYMGHKQDVPEKEGNQGGWVSIDFIEGESTEAYAQKRLTQIQDDINVLLDAGYQQGDICILSRRNKSAGEVAAYLLEEGYRVISSESLLLSNSPRVRTIVDFLGLILHPDDTITQTSFIQNLIFSGLITGPLHDVVQRLEQDNGLSEDLNFNDFFGRVQGLSLYEMVEYAIREVLQSDAPNIYLQFFLDTVFEYQQMGIVTVDDFLKRWEEKKSKLYISMPEGEDAIQVMTVHKAKGLKFEALIVDISQPNLRNGKSEFWTPLQNEDLAPLKVGLLPINKELEHISLGRVVQQETDKTFIDFINLVYVAFTRPVSALMIIGHNHIGAKVKDQFAGLLINFLKDQGLWQEEGMHYNFGSLEGIQPQKSKNSISTIELNKMPSTEWEKLVQVAASDEVYWQLMDRKPARSYGKLVHDMLAHIHVADEVDQVIQQYYMEGTIDQDEQKHIKQVLEQITQHPLLHPLFLPGSLVKNESEIIDEQGHLHRPDRVVLKDEALSIIDYKTGDRDEKHLKQIRTYGSLFSKLGYQTIQLLLVYINDTVDVVEIK